MNQAQVIYLLSFLAGAFGMLTCLLVFIWREVEAIRIMLQKLLKAKNIEW